MGSRRTGPGFRRHRNYTPEEIAGRLERLRLATKAARERRAQARAQVRQEFGLDASLSARWWEVILLHLSGFQPPEIARMLGYSVPDVVRRILRRPEVAGLLEKVRTAQLERIIAGDFGVRAQAKAAAPKAMEKIAQLATDATKDADKIKAGQTVLQVAGEMMQRHEHQHAHRLVKDMTDEELEALSARGVWPARYQTLVAKLGIGTSASD